MKMAAQVFDRHRFQPTTFSPKFMQMTIRQQNYLIKNVSTSYFYFQAIILVQKK
jgi:hypothetical protein